MRKLVQRKLNFSVCSNDAHSGVFISVNVNLNPNEISIDTDIEVYFINLNLSGLTFKIGVVYGLQTFNRNGNRNLYKS